jgi:hypothetical protein
MTTLSLYKNSFGYNYTNADIAYITKKGYAILDNQNLHIKVTRTDKESLVLCKKCKDPFIFLLWRVYHKK